MPGQPRRARRKRKRYRRSQPRGQPESFQIPRLLLRRGNGLVLPANALLRPRSRQVYLAGQRGIRRPDHR